MKSICLSAVLAAALAAGIAGIATAQEKKTPPTPQDSSIFGETIVLERLLYRRLYKISHLDQVLLTIGLLFMASAVAHYFFGPSQQPVKGCW